MLFRLLFIVLNVSLFSVVNAQTTSDVLDDFFAKSEVQTIDTRSILESRDPSSSTFRLTVSIDGSAKVLVLTPNNMFRDHYIVRYADDTGVHQIADHQRAIPTMGAVLGDPSSRASITINDGFIYGRISTQGKDFYIEPLHYYAKAVEDQFVVYNVADVLDDAPHTCGVNEAEHRRSEVQKQVEDNAQRSMMSCYEVDWAIANDFQMFQSKGSVVGVENHAIGVANDVQTNYDDEFADEIQLFISEQFVAATAAADPWTSSNNAGTFLNSFSNWGPSGFSFAHDIGSIWTARNFSGSTIGIAWLGVVCENLRYNALEDFSNNGNLKRVMVSHELGHNFDAVHDGGGGFIMSPSVNNTTTWSNQSINDIESHYLSRNCLATCAGSGVSAPDPGFDVFYITECASLFNGTFGEVEFFDLSTNSPTSWSWEFEGGDPATSTLANPTIFYDNPGTFNVTLTVGNSGGSNTNVFTNAVTIIQDPFADFVVLTNGLVADFDNISSFGNSYLWDFGDGNTSTDIEPIHTYAADGTYTVSLTAVNGVCSNTFDQQVTIISAPTASVSSNITSGCIDLEVEFSASASSNSVAYEWLFEGGNPATSVAIDPTVTYTTPGTFDVRLIATSAGGLKDTLDLVDYVTVLTTPSAGFTATASGLSVTFVNTSTDFDSVSWDFGDGAMSTANDPNHTYTTPGDYTVVMMVTNTCGTTQATQVFDIEVAPTAGWSSNILPIDILCAPHTVSFVADEQNNLDSYAWTFVGGLPSTSTDPNPQITYFNPGQYDVKLVVTNDVGVDSITLTNYVTITDLPTAAFNSTNNLLTFDFVSLSTGAITYLWDFGDGSTSTDPNPSYTYASPGVYTVTHTVTNDCGSDMSMQQVSVQSTPVAAFTSDVTEGCVDLTVQYTSTSSANTTGYAWTFAGGSPSTSSDAAPVVTYSVVGTFDVQLIASNAVGSDTTVFVDYLVANDVPLAAFTTDVSGNVVTMTDISLDAEVVSYAVDGVDLSGDTFTAAANGTYTITQTATNSCGTDQESIVVTITAFPSVSIDGQGQISGCAPLNAMFTSVAGNVDTYVWTVNTPTVQTSTDANPTFTFVEDGLYTVEVTATNTAGSTTVSTVIEVDIIELPTADFVSSLNAGTASFIASDAGAVSYTWDYGDGNTGAGMTAQHTYTQTGIYTVQLTVVGECGTMTSSQEIQVEINTSVVSFDADITSGCAPLTVSFMDFSSNDPTSWAWTFPGGTPATSTEANPVVIYDTPGTYAVELMVTNAFGPSTSILTDYITVTGPPDLDLDATTTGAMVSITTIGLGADMYNWDMGDGTKLEGDEVRHTYAEPGTYTVTLVASNACGSDTTSVDVVIATTSTDDLSTVADIAIYPNPARDYVQVAIEGLSRSIVDIEIYDLTGKLIQTDVAAGDAVTTIDVSSLSQGSYIVRLSAKDKSAYHKMILLK